MNVQNLCNRQKEKKNRRGLIFLKSSSLTGKEKRGKKLRTDKAAWNAWECVTVAVSSSPHWGQGAAPLAGEEGLRPRLLGGPEGLCFACWLRGSTLGH